MRLARITFVSLMLVLLCAALYAAPARLSFGTASISGDRLTVPVYVEGNVARVEAIALRVSYPHGAVASAAIHRSGITAAASPMFETAVNGTDATGFIASFSDPVVESADLARTVIAEVELTFAADAPRNLQLALDPNLCTLGEKTGTNMLSVAKGTLAVGQASIDRGAGRRGRAIQH